MRLAVFIGLLYVAWCINPTTFDSIDDNTKDLIIINVVVFLATFSDLVDLLNKLKK